ncbi:hypothetical protein GIB67_020691 [Kingdonia uniflora]|uniref:RNase H type-1 domain-containing protein n=1 Tax=Kingdonia uniflora TaxID=39325 RepID=A0A7J7NJL7_9MAGN|nr:hypothetical protein GIB67_020691 [Kingdonia uniflora]
MLLAEIWSLTGISQFNGFTRQPTAAGNVGSFGTILRTWDGGPIKACAGRTRPHNIIIHELQGIKLGLIMAIEEAIDYLMVYTDSAAAVSFLTNKTAPPWEANQAADDLAKLKPMEGLVVILPGAFTLNLKKFTHDDKHGRLYVRLAESAKSQFAGQDYSDHVALERAYEGWKKAEREQHSGYEYCWKNFLSIQTLKAMDSLRKQFLSLLTDAGLVDHDQALCNEWSHDIHLIRAVICAGLYPGICSVVVSLSLLVSFTFGFHHECSVEYSCHTLE